MELGPGALFDLASLEPSISSPASAALERETVSRLAVPNGRVIRLTFSKDKLFRPRYDRGRINNRGRRGRVGPPMDQLRFTAAMSCRQREGGGSLAF